MNEQMSKRRFKFWDYNVSHNQLLIRSPKNEEFNTNIDIKFIGVSYLDIPTIMTGFFFSEPSIDEVSKVKVNLPAKSESDNIFVLSSLNNRYIIVAKFCGVSENELDIFETTLEIFGHEAEKWEKLKEA